MGRRKTQISDSTLDMIVSIDQRLTELVNSDLPKRLHCIEEKLDKLITLTLANNFGAENPFNPNASEKAANDFFANIIDPERKV